jgi:hypothetical protein
MERAATPFRELESLVSALGLETVLQAPQATGEPVGCGVSKAVFVAVGVRPLEVGVGGELIAGVGGELVVLVPQELSSTKQLLMTRSKRYGFFKGFIKGLLLGSKQAVFPKSGHEPYVREDKFITDSP